MHKHVQSRVDHTSTTVYLCYLRLFLRNGSKNEMYSHVSFLWFGLVWLLNYRSALLYQGPLLRSGGSPSRLRHRSRIEPGTYINDPAITVRIFTSEFCTIFRLTCGQGPGLPGFQVFFHEFDHTYLFKVFGLLLSLYFRADWSVVTQNPAWKWFWKIFSPDLAWIKSSKKFLDSTRYLIWLLRPFQRGHSNLAYPTWANQNTRIFCTDQSRASIAVKWDLV